MFFMDPYAPLWVASLLKSTWVIILLISVILLAILSRNNIFIKISMDFCFSVLLGLILERIIEKETVMTNLR